MSGQVDRLLGLVGNTGIKVAVQAASTGVLVLSGEQTVDGIALVTGDRVLVKDQASSIANGIYDVDTGDWDRSKDADGTYDLTQGSLVLVYAGTVNGNKIYKCTTANPVICGTSNLTFSALSAELTGSGKSIWAGTATGTANALVLTPATVVAAADLQAGLAITFKAGAAGNSAATTIAVSGQAAIAAQNNGNALVGGEIIAGKWYRATLDGTAAAYQLEQLAPAVLIDMFTAAGDIAVASADGVVVRQGIGTDGYPWQPNSGSTNKGAYLPPGLGFNLVGGYLDWTVAANALTCAVKTWAGNDPSATEPVFYAVRDVTAGTGSLTYRKLTAATSVTINNTALMGTVNAIAFRLWAVMFNDGGTDRLGLINCVTTAAGVGTGRDVTAMYPLAGFGIASSTLSDNAADNAQVFYTNAAVASKAYSTIGYATWEAGQAAAGVWATAATRKQLYGPGVPLPGTPIQTQRSVTGAVATGATVMPNDDTIPQSGEGDQYLSQAITFSSAANVRRDKAQVLLSSSAVNQLQAALFQDAVANAIASTYSTQRTAGDETQLNLDAQQLTGTTAAVTMKVRAGGNAAATTTFNGTAGGRIHGGVLNSYLQVEEIMG